jgi:hypothetical protein
MFALRWLWFDGIRTWLSCRALLVVVLAGLVVSMFLGGSHRAQAQSLIVGIPSADVAEQGHFEITHESQWNFDSGVKWNSFNFGVFGIGYNTELALSLINVAAPASNNIALGFGFKTCQPIFPNLGSELELKATLGQMFFVSAERNRVAGTDIGGWLYGHVSGRIPGIKTRLTAGMSYGSSHAFGYRVLRTSTGETNVPNTPVAAMIGIEQPLFGPVSFVADWISGTHDLAAFIPAIQIDIGPHVAIFGYKIPNNAESGVPALVTEFMFSIGGQHSPQTGTGHGAEH